LKGEEEKGTGRKRRDGGENDLTHPLSQIPGYATGVNCCTLTADDPDYPVAE